MRLISASFTSAALAGMALGFWPGMLAAQTQTETKIKLMSDALAARDHGDLAVAKGKLEELQAIAPNDPGVRRILAEVTARLEAPPTPAAAPVVPSSAPAVQVAPVPAPPTPLVAPLESGPLNLSSTPAETPVALAAAGRVLMPVVHEEKPDTPAVAAPMQKPAVSPEAMAADAASEALLHADDNRLGTLMAYVQAQRALARAQAREKNYAAAIATLDAALEELAKPSEELREERSDYVRAARQAADAADAATGLKMHPHR